MNASQTINGQQWVEIIQATANEILARRDHLSALDATIGDGDHGLNIAKALSEAARQVRQLEAPTPESVLRTTGIAVTNTMGGAAGVLFGAFFLGGSRVVKDKAALTLDDLATMAAAGLAEVQKRGKAQPGDKTMVDALTPAVAALQQAKAANLALPEALQQAASQAQAGAEATRDMVARFGRAKFLGERSLGHPDAGATSIAIMLTAWADHLAIIKAE